MSTMDAKIDVASRAQLTVKLVHSTNAPKKPLHPEVVRTRRKWLDSDSFGIAAAAICLVHCLAFPVVAMSLPVLAANSAQEDLTHYALAGFVAAFCAFAIVPGYKRHRRKDVLAAMIIGVGLVMFATFIAQPLLGHVWEMPLITAGNFIVVAAHLRNRKLLSTSCC